MTSYSAIRVPALCAMLLSASPGLVAQSATSLVGEVIDQTRRVDQGWSIEFRSTTESRSQPPLRAYLQPDGQFRVFGVAPGSYEAVVLDSSQHEVKREIVAISGHGYSVLQIRLGAPGAGKQKAPAYPISMRQLQHRVPKQASKEFAQAIRDRDRHHPEKAEAHFLKALALDPEFLEAANDLGVLYYRERRYSESLKTLEQAHAVEQDSPVVLANLAATLLALGRAAEAEPAARRAMSLDPTSIRSRYVFGLSRSAMGNLDAETKDALAEASITIPHAHLALARLHAAKGELPAARQALKQYIAAAQPALGAAERVKAEGWLNSLR